MSGKALAAGTFPTQTEPAAIALPLTRGLDVIRLIGCIGPATAAISRYDGLLQSIVNPSVMLSPLTQREAVLSSRIEGTQATVDEGARVRSRVAL